MEIAGLRVPDAFLDAASADLNLEGDVLYPYGGVDAYGYPLTLGLAQVYREPVALLRATLRVAIGFEADDWYGARLPVAAGAIADIVDFSRILCFGSSVEGEPFCFDFRDDPAEPSIICWDGNLLSWRRVDIRGDAFLCVFRIQE